MSDVAQDEGLVPGWDAIDRAVDEAYGRHAPSRILRFQDSPWQRELAPLSAIRVFTPSHPRPHWHFISYGLTDLFRKSRGDPEVSGAGHELTFRLERPPAVRTTGSTKGREGGPGGSEMPPRWAINLMLFIADHVRRGGGLFPGLRLGLAEPLSEGATTALCALLLAPDPGLEPTRSPFGEVGFLQMVGITRDEVELLSDWNPRSFLELLDEHEPLWVTRLSRRSVLSDAGLAARVQERVKREGSSSRTAVLPSLRWFRADEGGVITLTVDPKELSQLRRALEGRLPFGRELVARGEGGQEVLFQAVSQPGVSCAGQRLTLCLPRSGFPEMLATLLPEPGTYALPWLEGVVIRVVETP